MTRKFVSKPLLFMQLALVSAALMFSGCDDAKIDVDPDNNPGQNDKEPGTDDPNEDDPNEDDPVTVECPPEDGVERTLQAWSALNQSPTSGVGEGFRTIGVTSYGWLDARAGGTAAASSNSFRYVSFANGGPLELSDVDALESGDWDIAFRRTSVRVNSGQSGPGEVELARIQETSFEEVVSVPTNVVWADDNVEWLLVDSVDPDTDEVVQTCVLDRDPFGLPYGAVNKVNFDTEPSGSWYAYGGPGGVSPVENVVYLLRKGDAVWKLSLDGYDGAVWNLRWAPLLGACSVPEDVNVDALFNRKTDVYSYDEPSTVEAIGTNEWRAELQTSVGGFGGAFAMTYLDLEQGLIVDQNDVEAATNSGWTIGVRRGDFVLNGGDAGPGNFEIARLEQDYNSVTTVPAHLLWERDEIIADFVGEENTCDILTAPMGGAQLAMNRVNWDRPPIQSWYSYVDGAMSPYEGITYLIRDSVTHETFKFEIEEYAHSESILTVRWSAL